MNDAFINCDSAFELMTDSAGHDSPALQDHLVRCARCRQMRETLAPAFEWLSSGERVADAPTFGWSEIPALREARRPVTSEALDEALGAAVDAARSLARRPRSLSARISDLGELATRHAAALMIGALCATVFASMLQRGHREPAWAPFAPAATAAHCTRRESASSRSGNSPVAASLVVATCASCHPIGNSPGK